MHEGRTAVSRMRDAANSPRLDVSGDTGSGVVQAAAMLREREPDRTDAAALAGVRGHLADLLDVLEVTLNPRRTRRPRSANAFEHNSNAPVAV